jgi:glc operon protein GlcG
VCDHSGALLAFARGEGAPLRSIQISQGKAYSAARMGVDTNAFLERLQRDRLQARDFCDDRLTALPGGAVLRGADGRLLGGLGISGLTSAQDHVIATALAAEFASTAPPPA